MMPAVESTIDMEDPQARKRLIRAVCRQMGRPYMARRLIAASVSLEEACREIVREKFLHP
jgi:hypothetical protein